MECVSVESEAPMTLASAVEALRDATGFPWTTRRLLLTVVHRQINLQAVGSNGQAPEKLVELRAAEAEALLLGFGRNGRFLERWQVTFRDGDGAFTPSGLPRLADVRISATALEDLQRVWALGAKGVATVHDLPPWMHKHFLSAASRSNV